MKTGHYILFILLALIAGYVGASFKNHQPISASKNETAYERVLRTKTLRCGYGMWPPIVLKKDPNTGEMTGVAKDIMEAIGKNLSLKIDWVEEVGWDSQAEALKAGRFDVFCATLWRTAARGREIRFTIPLYYNPVYAYVRSNDTRFDKNLNGLNDPSIRISGQDGEISERIARNYFQKATYVGQPQMSELSLIFLNVADNKADIVFNSPDVAEGFMEKNPGKLKRVSEKPFMFYTTAFGVAMNESNLQNMLDSALTELHDNGSIEKILQHYNAKRDQFFRVDTNYKQ